MSRLPFRLAAVSSAVLSLTGCLFDGGGGSSAPATSSSTPTAVTLSGSSYKGPTLGAKVCAYVIDNAATDKKGAKVAAQNGTTPTLADGCAVTGIDGTYTLVLPAGTTGNLLLESTGGTYCNDESLYNGSTCAGGGVPVAMGSAKLSTVVAAPAGGVVASTPITVLTTAATRSAAGALDPASFKAAYGTVAGGFGVTDTDPAGDPKAEGKLKSALANLATYLGADTSLLDSVVSQAGAGTLKAGTTELEAEGALTCSPLQASDLAYLYTSQSMNWMLDPITMTPILMPGAPVVQTISSYGFGTSTCTASTDGQTSSRFLYSVTLGGLLQGAPLSGTYYEYRYSGSTCSTYVSSAYAPMTLQAMGTQAIPLSASTDPAKSQSGTATKLQVVLQTGGTLALTAPRVENHLFCRTVAAPANTYQFKGYLTSSASPVVNGSYSRLDSRSELGTPTWWD